MTFILVLGLLYFMTDYLSFSGQSDIRLDKILKDILIEDRKTIFLDELVKTLFYILTLFVVIALFIKNKIKTNLTLFLLIFITCFDLISFSKLYVNEQNFTESINVENPFNLDETYKNIMSDKSDFRILDLTESSTKPNYYFNSINGYHAAKLGRYNDVMNFYLNKNHFNTLSMLNTKYIIFEGENNKEVYENDKVSGSAWFVNENINVDSDNEEILTLDNLNFKNTSVSQEFESKRFNNDKSSVRLIEKKSNLLKYEATTDNPGLIIFSEIFYPFGWNSYIEGKKVKHMRFNYILRGLEVPEGKYEIEFRFEPEIVKTSSKISLFSTISFLLLLIIGFSIKIKN